MKLKYIKKKVISNFSKTPAVYAKKMDRPHTNVADFNHLHALPWEFGVKAQETQTIKFIQSVKGKTNILFHIPRLWEWHGFEIFHMYNI